MPDSPNPAPTTDVAAQRNDIGNINSLQDTRVAFLDIARSARQNDQLEGVALVEHDGKAYAEVPIGKLRAYDDLETVIEPGQCVSLQLAPGVWQPVYIKQVLLDITDASYHLLGQVLLEEHTITGFDQHHVVHPQGLVLTSTTKVFPASRYDSKPMNVFFARQEWVKQEKLEATLHQFCRWFVDTEAATVLAGGAALANLHPIEMHPDELHREVKRWSGTQLQPQGWLDSYDLTCSITRRLGKLVRNRMTPSKPSVDAEVEMFARKEEFALVVERRFPSLEVIPKRGSRYREVKVPASRFSELAEFVFQLGGGFPTFPFKVITPEQFPGDMSVDVLVVTALRFEYRDDWMDGKLKVIFSYKLMRPRQWRRLLGDVQGTGDANLPAAGDARQLQLALQRAQQAAGEAGNGPVEASAAAAGRQESAGGATAPTAAAAAVAAAGGPMGMPTAEGSPGAVARAATGDVQDDESATGGLQQPRGGVVTTTGRGGQQQVAAAGGLPSSAGVMEEQARASVAGPSTSARPHGQPRPVPWALQILDHGLDRAAEADRLRKLKQERVAARKRRAEEAQLQHEQQQTQHADSAHAAASARAARAERRSQGQAAPQQDPSPVVQHNQRRTQRRVASPSRRHSRSRAPTAPILQLQPVAGIMPNTSACPPRLPTALAGALAHLRAVQAAEAAAPTPAGPSVPPSSSM